MKKRYILSLLLIFCLLIFPLSACDNSNDKTNDGPPGSSYAKVSGIKIELCDENNQEFDTVSSTRPDINDGFTLSLNQRYILIVGLVQSGGSTPSFLQTSGVAWEYDSEVISLIEYDEESLRPIYYLEFKKPTNGTNLQLNAGGYTLNVNVVVTE